MASFQPYPGGVRVQVYVRGRRDSATFPTKREAQLWAARRTLELERDASGTAGEFKTLGDAMRRYMDEVSPGHRGGRWEVIRLTALLADPALPVSTPLAKLRSSQLTDWKNARLLEVKPGTVLRELGHRTASSHSSSARRIPSSFRVLCATLRLWTGGMCLCMKCAPLNESGTSHSSDGSLGRP